VDETYVKVAGRWRHAYRAVDQSGQVIGVFGSPRRDTTAARWCFQQAIDATKVPPVEVVTDTAAAYPIVLGRCCRWRGTVLSSMRTTTSRPITAA
jgi:IS6 family transposase